MQALGITRSGTGGEIIILNLCMMKTWSLIVMMVIFCDDDGYISCLFQSFPHPQRSQSCLYSLFIVDHGPGASTSQHPRTTPSSVFSSNEARHGPPPGGTEAKPRLKRKAGVFASDIASSCSRHTSHTAAPGQLKERDKWSEDHISKDNIT